jgi:alkylhydroperoxidase family enzyme
MDPKYADKLRELERRLLDGPGSLDPAARRAAADGGPVPEDLSAYVEKVRRHANKVTDEDVRGLLDAGWSEDQIFELTVAAAYGAARRRLNAGLGAMTS